MMRTRRSSTYFGEILEALRASYEGYRLVPEFKIEYGGFRCILNPVRRKGGRE